MWVPQIISSAVFLRPIPWLTEKDHCDLAQRCGFTTKERLAAAIEPIFGPDIQQGFESIRRDVKFTQKAPKEIKAILTLPVFTQRSETLILDDLVGIEGEALIKNEGIKSSIDRLSHSIDKAYLLKWLFFMDPEDDRCMSDPFPLIYRLFYRKHFKAVDEVLDHLVMALELNGPHYRIGHSTYTMPHSYLHLAASLGKPGRRWEEVDKEGVTLCIRIIDQLVARGADIDQSSFLGETALHFAAKSGAIELVECLLKHQANPNAKNAQGLTPMKVAMVEKHHEIVCLLKKAEALNLNFMQRNFNVLKDTIPMGMGIEYAVSWMRRQRDVWRVQDPQNK